MKSQQSGFAHAFLITGLVVALIGALGFVFWQNFIYEEPVIKSVVIADLNKEKEQNNAKPFDTSVHEVNVRILSLDDVSKLPVYTPSSFKKYISDKLTTNGDSSADCSATQYTVSSISQVNIRGAGGSVSSNGETCGAAPILWVLAPNGTWDEESLNGGPYCKSKNGGFVYEEFAMECLPAETSNSLVRNPNGSIEALKN